MQFHCAQVLHTVLSNTVRPPSSRLPCPPCPALQYTTPFSSVDLTKMAEAFNTTVG
jgi:hypothetical protein